MHYSQFLLVAASILAPATALGINCRGSSNCAGAPGNIQGVLAAVEQANQDRIYYDQEHVGCVNNLCAFWQNGAQGTAGEAATSIRALISHGCTKCGSNPTDGNDVNNGELTINWVLSPGKRDDDGMSKKPIKMVA